MEDDRVLGHNNNDVVIPSPPPLPLQQQPQQEQQQQEDEEEEQQQQPEQLEGKETLKQHEEQDQLEQALDIEQQQQQEQEQAEQEEEHQAPPPQQQQEQPQEQDQLALELEQQQQEQHQVEEQQQQAQNPEPPPPQQEQQPEQEDEEYEEQDEEQDDEQEEEEETIDKTTLDHIASIAIAQQEQDQLYSQQTGEEYGIEMYLTPNAQQIVAMRHIKSVYTVMVLSIRRFLIDKHYLYVCGLDDQMSDDSSNTTQLLYDAYDLIVTDSKNVMKWTLSPSLNSLITKHSIRNGSIITVDDYRILFDEKIEGGGDGIVFISSIATANPSHAPVQAFNSDLVIQQLSELFADELFDLSQKPLTGSRGYYCPLWDDDNFEQCQIIDRVGGVQEMANRKSLSHILQTNNEKGRVIGRVHKKSKLNHFARGGANSSDQSQEYPFYFTLLLVDDSMEHGIPVNIWNRLALNHYHDIHVGDVLLITGYRIKKCYNANSVFPLAPDQQPYTKEISVNSQKQDNIFKFDEASSEFAPFAFEPVTIRDLHFLPDKTNISIAGIVIKLGPYERERIHSSPDGIKYQEPKYTQFRYITIIDSTSRKKVNCKLYTNSRKDRLDRIQLSDIVLLSDMTVYSVCATSRVTQREFLLQSSLVTSVFVEDDMDNLFPILTEIARDRVNALSTFLDEHAESFDLFGSNELQVSSIPHINIATYQLYKEMFPRHDWCFFKELFSISEELQFMETRTVAVQAYIHSIVDALEKKRKRAVPTKQIPPRKKQRENIIASTDATNEIEEQPITQTSDEGDRREVQDIDGAEEEFETNDEGTNSYEESNSHLSLTVTLEDMNRMSSVSSILNIWRLQSFHPLVNREKATNMGSMRSLLHQFFHLNDQQAITDENGAGTYSSLVSSLMHSVKNKLFICCVQMTRKGPDSVDFLLTQCFPVVSRHAT